jgi:uncharacterized protein (TIGR03066 family)
MIANLLAHHTLIATRPHSLLFQETPMLVHLIIGLMLFSPTSLQDSKIDGKLFVGKWEAEKKPDGVDKIVVEFTKDEKVHLTIDAQGQTNKIEGTYKLKGDKLTVKIKVNDQEQEQERTIVKLTENELVTKGDDGEERKYKKVK